MDSLCFDIFNYILVNFLQFDDVLNLRLVNKSYFEQCTEFFTNKNTFTLLKYIMMLGRIIERSGEMVDDPLDDAIFHLFPTIGCGMWDDEKGIILVDKRKSIKSGKTKIAVLLNNQLANNVFGHCLFYHVEFMYHITENNDFYLFKFLTTCGIKYFFDLKNDKFTSEWFISPRGYETLPFLINKWPTMKELGIKYQTSIFWSSNDLLLLNNISSENDQNAQGSYRFSYFNKQNSNLNQIETNLILPKEWSDHFPLKSNSNIQVNNCMVFMARKSSSRVHDSFVLVWFHLKKMTNIGLDQGCWNEYSFQCILLNQDSVWFLLKITDRYDSITMVYVLQVKNDGTLWISKNLIKPSENQDIILHDFLHYYHDNFIILFQKNQIVLKINTLDPKFKPFVLKNSKTINY